MEKYNVKFKRKYGQNFLKDISIVKRIVSVAAIDNNSLVIEVGPGGGIMTKELAGVASNVLAYEIDVDLKLELNKRLNGYSNIEVLYKDFLNSDLCGDIAKYDYNNLYFVSNVPYYITTPIILKLIGSNLKFKKIVMMVQKEVGDRFSSKCGNKEYGSISVLLQYFYDVKEEFLVSREEFVPVPDVDSVIISFSPKENQVLVKDFAIFEKLVKDSFKFKRKNLKNNLKGYNLNKISDILAKFDLNLNCRAEQLDILVFVTIANAITDNV